MVVAFACAAFACEPGTKAPAAAVELGQPRGDLTAAESAAFERGRVLFSQKFEPAQGLGPFYNDVSCTSCHDTPTVGGSGDMAHAARLGAVPGAVHLVALPRHAIEGRPSPAVPTGATVIAVRPPPLYGLGLIDRLTEADLRAACDPDDADHDGVRGHVDLRDDGRLGRFGQRALNASLTMMVALAAAEEMGLTNDFQNKHPGDDDAVPDPELGPEAIRDLTAFVRGLAPPARGGAEPRGEHIFSAFGCAACHTPVLARKVPGVYSDFCVHGMGPALDTGAADHGYSVASDEWRTTPLWGLRHRHAYLHDERASSLEQAISLHGGEAQGARDRFNGAAPEDRAALLAFLGTL